MTTIILTDRVVATDDGMYDPASIARFVVEHARDDSVRVYLVIDMMNRDLHPLADFARASGFVVWSDEINAAITHAGADDDVVVCDPEYVSDDPRVTVKRRITR